MINSLFLIIIAASILIVLFFAYLTKNKLATLVAYTMLAAVAASMALNGMAGLINDVDFLSFLVDLLRFLGTIVLFVELGIIVFLLFFSKQKSKIMLLKVVIIVYVVVKLFVEFNVFN